MSVIERIRKIGERWFLTEPLLFAVFCSHEFRENESLTVPMRTGNRKVEFVPEILANVTDAALTEFLKVEMLRILLKHPYQRQPPFAVKSLLTRASNVTIADVYEVSRDVKAQMNGAELDLPSGLCFEEYYALLKEMSVPMGGALGEHDSYSEGDAGEGCVGELGECAADGKGGENNGGVSRDAQTKSNAQDVRDSQISELWNEDEESCCDINGFIEVAEAGNKWGSISGKLQSIIKASLKVDMDYRKMLSLFKTSVISSKRRLTRMRPNRRFGFDAMGSRYELSTNLLIAVDVSGSVTDKSLSFFFSVINRLFKYGIEKLDVLQFDAKIQGEPEPLKKVCKTVKVMGRGGTSFQPAADYYCAHPEYDGLIYFSDGYAPPPKFNTKRPIDVLWVLCGKSAYDANSKWIKELKRNRVTYIPKGE
ncbi:VWA-like domain-containing protein [uncultured Fibrobacter sp.]|uniref:VWA-like domain-containing protein n=1 Tax=uncultured Fibrobacter sp. TaxID=261512 RepID=UPI002634FA02|nr:VWA-like domain-containing protein [uncultured Fibrobacter sp.]